MTTCYVTSNAHIAFLKLTMAVNGYLRSKNAILHHKMHHLAKDLFPADKAE